MGFAPFELSVKEIFSNDRRYQIPNFQRNFSWESDNFDDFFNDLVRSSRITVSNTKVDAGNKYFFGTILLLGVKESPNIDVPYEVIDGQQRLTTMTLFFAAIQDIIREKNKDYKTDFDDRLFCSSTSQGKLNQCQRLVNDSLNPVLPVSILNLNNLRESGAEVKIDSGEQDWLISAFDYIKKLFSKDNIALSINADVSNLDDDTYLYILDGLGNHLSNSTLISIFHNDKEEANTLFRNLNYRGKPLSQADLIKNELFSLVEDTGKLASTDWKQIEDNIYEAGEGLQKFIYHYMYGRYLNITNNNMFDKFTHSVNADTTDYLKFLDSLKKASEFYKIILMPEDNNTIFNEVNYFKTDNNPSIKRNLEFFKNIEISQCRILLITLFECREKNVIDNKTFRKFIELIAIHQCLHVLVSSSPNRLTSIYAKASRALIALKEKDKTKYKTESSNIFDTLKKDLVDRLPDINVVQESTLNYSGSKIADMRPKERKDHMLIRFILQKLSEHEQEETANRGNDGLGFIFLSTLEHIIDRENNIDNVFSLGNIILLERDVHEAVKTLEQKKEMYSKSKITLTRNFFNEYTDFNQGEILERQRELLRKYYELVKGF